MNKNHFILQQTQSDCGIACLASIINYYEGNAILHSIRHKTGTKKTGVTLLGLYEAASDYGFDVEGYRLDDLSKLEPPEFQPSILHVVLNKLNHFVVFYGIKNNKAIIGDPSVGIVEWTLDKLDEVWVDKQVLQLTPNSNFDRVNKSKQEYNNYKRFFSWLRKDVNILTATLFLGLIISIFSLSTAIFTQKLIDVLLPSEDLKKIVIGIFLFSLILIIRAGLDYIRSYFLISQSRDFNNRMINSILNSILSLPKAFFDSLKTGDMVARMNDTQRIQTVIGALFGNIIIEVLVILSSIIGIFIYSWQVGVLVISLIPIYGVVLIRFNKPIEKSQKELMQYYSLNESNFIDVLSGVAEIKINNTQRLFNRLTSILYFEYQDKTMNLGRVQIKFNFITSAVGILLTILIVMLSSYLVYKNIISIGALIAILTLSGAVGPSLNQGILFNIRIQEAKVAYNRIKEYSDMKSEKNSGFKKPIISSFEMKNISFNYPGTLRLLDNISFVAKKGQIISILGESGSGKSTIFQLIQRFYCQKQGQILVNNEPVEDIDTSYYRDCLAVVQQDIKLFNNNLAFNICLSDKESELERVISFCEDYGFDKYFKKLPQGFNTLLGEEGINISGGQKQLVAIARALFRDPQFIIIDEGTSALDKETEGFVIDMLKQIKQNKIILLSTHRVELAQESDHIYIIENGKFNHQGTPADLIKSDRNIFGRSFKKMLNTYEKLYV